MNFRQAAIALSSALFLSAANGQTVVDIVVGSEDHSTLEALVIQAGLVDTLSGEGPFTVMAPLDSAFTALGGAADKYTTEGWNGHLTDILTYHVISGTVTSADLPTGEVTMVNGQDTDVVASPPTINSANVVAPFDVNAANGVVHSIDAVLLPAFLTAGTIVDIAAGADDFSTLVSLVTQAGLVDALNGEGPLTVFAPTNAAFEALGQETLDMLALPENADMLTNILTYHVIGANVYQAGLASGDVTMLNEDMATVVADSDAPTIAGAPIAGAEILATNGVIHPISAVMMPPADDTDMEGDTEEDMETPPETTPDGDEGTPAPTDDSAATSVFGTTMAAVSALVAMYVL